MQRLEESPFFVPKYLSKDAESLDWRIFFCLNINGLG
jgi:hypothetical protein